MRTQIFVGLASVALVLGGCATDRYDDRYDPPPRASTGNPLADALGGLLGGAGSSTRSDDRYGDRRDRDRRYREEMERLEAEQRRLDDERREIERRYGRS